MKCVIYFVFSLFIFSNIYCQEAQVNSTLDEGTLNWVHNLPRRTIDGRDVEPNPYSANTADYGSAIGAIAFLPASFALTFLFTGCILACCRWGGGCCKIENDTEEPKLLVYKIIIGCLLVISFGFLLFFFIGNGLAAKGVETFQTELTARAKFLSERGIQTIENLEDEISEPQLDRMGEDVKKSMLLIDSRAQDTSDYASSFELGRVALIALSSICLLLVLIVGLVSLFVKIPWVSSLSIFFVFLSLAFLWGCIAINWGAITAAADYCYAVQPLKGFNTTHIPSAPTSFQNHTILTRWNSTGSEDWVVCGSKVSFANHFNRLQFLRWNNELNLTDSSKEALDRITVQLMLLYRCDWVIGFSLATETAACNDIFSGGYYVSLASFILTFVLLPLIVIEILYYRKLEAFKGGV